MWAGLWVNIFQHPNPKGVVKALMSMIHDGVTPDSAWETYQASLAETST